jgi:hypothetical protein
MNRTKARLGMVVSMTVLLVANLAGQHIAHAQSPAQTSAPAAYPSFPAGFG